jgi:chemotaxis protein MotA
MARTQASRVLDPPARSSVISRTKARIDHATFIGLIAAFGLVIAAMLIGGTARSFMDLPSVLIVIGGTFGVTTISFSLGDIARLPSVVLKALFHSIPNPSTTALHMLRLAELARKRGILGLDQILETMRHEPFVHKAVTLAVDGAPVDEIRTILQREINEMSDRHVRAAGVLRKAAEVAPAMGLIGTLIGLVQMLGNLSNPSTIGPGLAIALLTTFYGAVLANMVFAPLASKLERNTASEILIANIYMLAAESICRKDNPRRLELLLNAMLPPAKRITYFS